MTAENGQDYTNHMAGVIRSTITKKESVLKINELKEKHWPVYYPTPLGVYEYLMEPEAFDSLIQKLVQHHHFIAPTIAHTWWGWGTQIPHAKQWEAETGSPVTVVSNQQGRYSFPPTTRDPA